MSFSRPSSQADAPNGGNVDVHLVKAQTRDEVTEHDLQLAALANTGDPRAQRLLVSRLAPRVRRICKAIIGHRDNSQDAAQLALIEILRATGGYSGAGRLESWSDRITARAATRYLSKEQRHAAVACEEPSSAAPQPREPAFAERLARPLGAYLDVLPSHSREVLVLRHALDYTVSEIAELLDVPEGTVKDRLVRARKRIRKMIARDHALGTKGGAA